MPHLQGGKIANSHTTVIEAALPVVKKLAGLECVSKISLGLIKQISTTNTPFIKMTEVPAGLRVKVRGTTTIQELIIFTTDREKVREVVAASVR